MGDRGNVYIKDGDNGVFLYTHWSGYRISTDVKHALLKSKDNWDDCAYLARVIFDFMTELRGGTSGFGISTSIQDNERNIVVVDCDNQTVGFSKEDNVSNPFKSFTFDEYVSIEDDDDLRGIHIES